MTGEAKWYRPWSAYGDPKGYVEDVWKKSPTFVGPQLIGKELKKMQPEKTPPIPVPPPLPTHQEPMEAKKKKLLGRKANILAGRMNQILDTNFGKSILR